MGQRSGRVLRWGWEWWQAPATGPKRNRWLLRGRRVSLPLEERSRLFWFGRLREIARWLGARVWVPLLIRRAFCERAALGFWRARVRGAVLGRARSGRTLRGAAGAWQGGGHQLARRLRQAPLAGHVGAARALHLLRPIRIGTLGTVEPEKAAARARRAPIAAQGRPPGMMRLPHDAGRPPRGAHAVRAA